MGKLGKLGKRGKGRHFVPVEEVPPGGLSDRARELLALFLGALCLYGMLCLGTFRLDPATTGEIPLGPTTNLGGRAGFYLAYGFTFVFGFAAWLPFLLGLACAVILFLRKRVERMVFKVLGGLVLTAMTAVLLAGPTGDAGRSDLTPWGAGGMLGHNLSPTLEAAFGGPGRLLLVGFCALASFLLVTEWLVSSGLLWIGSMLRRTWGGARGAATAAGANVGGPAAAAKPAPPAPAHLPEPAPVPATAEPTTAGAETAVPPVPVPADDDEMGTVEVLLDKGLDDDPDFAETEPARVLVPRPRPRPRPTKAKPRPKVRRGQQADLPFAGVYPFPPLELFHEATNTDCGATSAVLDRNSDAIVQRLSSFGVQSEVVGVSVGPAVTQYELRLAEGIRVARLTSFEPDLAAALRAVSVRVVAPIPGKDTIGIEVPNEVRQLVFMRELLEQFGRAEDFAIPLFLGKDVAGCPIVEDLARMPHLLIAGTTGSGKSVCINSIMLSILMTRTPAQVRTILIDPKMVELQAYRSVPHLCCDVVTNMKKAPSVLQWAVEEMESRYALLSAAGVNYIRSYNRLGEEELRRRMQKEIEPERVQMPYIVLVMDELADLMAVAQNEVEESIQRLAQKSRAVGMHVILATQRPSTDVITGVIKANLPCQIAFKVNRKIDSRVILDQNGADKLLGYGDMLYVPPGGASMVRAQGTFVADDEIRAVTGYLEEHKQLPSFLPSLVQTQASSRPGPEQQDPMYREAVEVILGQQRGSATLLQRALAVGYTRATRLLEMMEADGVVGGFAGSKSREVLLTLDEWRVREAAMAEEMAAVAAGEVEPEDGVEDEGYDDEPLTEDETGG